MDEHLLWASAGTGARAGGFSFFEEDSFAGESILAVEVGTKSMFLENRLMLNLTGFWYDWDNPQISTTINAIPTTTNAPSATSYGVEAEFRYLPIDELMINGSFGWLRAFYDEDFIARDNTRNTDNPIPTLRGVDVNLNGNRVPRSPRFTVSFGIQYMIDLRKYGTITPRVDFYYRDEFMFRQYENPADLQPWYTRTDARITWYSEAGNYWFELFARNLENNAVKTNQEIQNTIYRAHYYDRPINGGFRIGYFFR
jgi:iron complex outermembrane receptor protein